MQNGLVYFSFSQLFKHGVHLGLQSTLLHSSMLKYLLPFNYLKFNLFNLNFAYASLRLVSNFILTMSSLRKFSLVVNSVSFLDDFLVDFFSGLNQPVARGLWVAGRLTNFRFVRQSSVRRFYLHKIIIRAFARIESLGLSNSIIRNIMNRTFNPIRYKQSVFRHVMNLTRMPRFCFINDSVINAVSVNECFILDIPSICSSDSGSSNHYQITYPIPGNSVSLYSVLLYYSIHKYSMQRGIYKERYLFILNTIKNKLKVASILKQLPIAYKLRLKTNVLAGIDLYTVPFTKVKMKLDVLSSSILNLNLFYKLLSTYNLFFTSNIGKFKKLMKKYVLLVKSISMYSDYLETIYNNNNKSIFLSRVLDQKFYSFILAINPNVTSDFSLKILKFLTIGDAVISSVLSDLYSKFNLTTNLLIKPYYISTNFLVVFDKKSRIGFLSLISKFIYNFNVYPNKIGGLFSELFYNQYTLCNLHSLSFAIDLFSINFLNLYKKLFLITSTLSKISNFFAFGNFINHYNVKFNSAASIRLFWHVASEEFNFLLSNHFYTELDSFLDPFPSASDTVMKVYSVSTQSLNKYKLFYKKLNLEYRSVRPFILSFTSLKSYYQMKRKTQFIKVTDDWFVKKSGMFAGQLKRTIFKKKSSLQLKSKVNSGLIFKQSGTRRW